MLCHHCFFIKQIQIASVNHERLLKDGELITTLPIATNGPPKNLLGGDIYHFIVWMPNIGGYLQTKDQKQAKALV